MIRPRRHSSIKSTSNKISARDVSPLGTQTRTTSRCSNFATETHARPDLTISDTISRTEAEPGGGSTHATPSAGLFATIQPIRRIRRENKLMSATLRSTCAAYPDHPATASERNSRSPKNRRDHWTLVSYGSTPASRDGIKSLETSKADVNVNACGERNIPQPIVVANHL